MAVPGDRLRIVGFNVLDIAGADVLSLIGYTAEPNSRSEDALRLLASWAATDHHTADVADATE